MVVPLVKTDAVSIYFTKSFFLKWRRCHICVQIEGGILKMANVLKMVASMVTGVDDVGDLVGEIEATRAKGIASSAQLEQLEQQRLVADTYDDAKLVEARIDRVRFEVEKLAAALPLLENRLSVARAARNRKLLAKHQDAARRLLPRLVAAVTSAAEIQQEAIEAREAAIRDLGEGAVQQSIEPIAYMGMLMKPFVAAWAETMQKRLAEPAPQPAVAAVVKPAHVPKVAAAKTVQVEPFSEPVKPKPRPLRNDKVAVSGRRVQMLRSGVDVDGFQSRTGDIIAVSDEMAKQLVLSGAADYASADAGTNV